MSKTPSVTSSLPGERRGVPKRAPRRDEIAANTVEVLSLGPSYKADLLLVDLGEGPMVVKDFGTKPWWSRFGGLFQTFQENRAYRWLGPLPCIPAFIGKIDSLALAVERVEGQMLVRAPDRYENGRVYLHRIRSIMDQFRELGFFHLDIRGYRNVMVRPDGELVALDLEGSFWVRPGSLLARLLDPWSLRIYKKALFKWKGLLTEGRSSDARKTRLRTAIQRLRMPHRWFLNREKRRRRDSSET